MRCVLTVHPLLAGSSNAVFNASTRLRDGVRPQLLSRRRASLATGAHSHKCAVAAKAPLVVAHESQTREAFLLEP
jgi:hypothetical protein